MSAVKFIQLDVPHSQVHDRAAEVKIPEEYSGWEPISVEFRGSTLGREYVRLAIWLRWAADAAGRDA